MNKLKKNLREQLKQQRLALPAEQQHQHAQRICNQLIEHPLFIKSQHIAFYHAILGEVNVLPALNAALTMGKSCFLPATRREALIFLSVNKDTPLITSDFGVLEPDPAYSTKISVNQLDLVLVPLLGFDNAGHRLGYGQGYYDRAFAFKLSNPACSPFLLGIGYDFQKINSIEPEPWDIHLEFAITPENFLIFP